MNAQNSGRYLVLLTATFLTGCGTNQFQQEVRTEEAAVKLANETVKGRYQLIDTDGLKEILDGDENFLLVDAMPAEDSYNKGHISRAVNFAFPKEVMDGWDDSAMAGRKKADFQQVLGDDKDRKLIFYCGFVRCARSHNAAVCARELGYKNVYRYPGGIYAWRGAGNTLTTD